MASQHFSGSSRLILIAEFIFVAYMLYALTTALYKSYQIDRHIAAFEAENVKIADENEQLSKDFAYFTSAAYQEKIAKQNFGLVVPGEQVIILPPDDGSYGGEGDLSVPSSIRRWDLMTNTEKWWAYFFERDRY